MDRWRIFRRWPGIPPLAGFWAKFYVFLPAIQAGFYTLAVIGVVASVVGAYYYLRIVKIMFFDEPAEKLLPARMAEGAVMALTALLVLFYVVWPGPLVDAAAAAAKSLY
jgi:NADH-quinone oxidoreductase subunit N